MALGRTLRELWRHRVGFWASVGLALLAALWSVASISLLPPGLNARDLETSTATTAALVDGRTSTALNLGVNTGDFVSITNRSLLIANIMASLATRDYIARAALVPADAIQITSPVTPDWPRPLGRPGLRQGTSDILKSPGEYRISVLSNPTVPEISVYATAPTPAAAAGLANGAIKRTQDYLRAVAAREGVAPDKQVRLRQLGVAKGVAINRGVSVKLALLAFVVVFALSAAATLFLARVRKGWQTAGGTTVAGSRTGA